jgi:thioredoxin reductase (NADPH)
MQDRTMKNPKISFLWDSEVVEIIGKTDGGKKSVSGVRVRNVKTGATSVMEVEGFFVGIGHLPNTALVQGQLNLDANGYIVTTPGTTATNVPGVFAAGDVADAVYRQAVTAAGTGCMAAIEAERFLERSRA